ncbi:hypothetical protein [Glutamicibacter sp. NPDC087344]|uniref:hypothetical protein n=1 Tax=Glutamicibacter sp. NPDC087344 TaxID=3363994 RepID=UPI0037FFC11F
MDFPSNITTVPITARLLVGTVDGPNPVVDREAVPGRFAVEFVPEVVKVPAPAATGGPTTFYRGVSLPEVVRGVVDSRGILCTADPDDHLRPSHEGVRLMATDDDIISVKDWTWRVTVKSLDGKLIESYSIAVPKSAAENGLDLTNLAPVPSTPGYGIPQAEAAAAAAAQDAQAARDAADETVSEGEVVGNELILKKRNGESFSAGNVRGAKGDKGDSGERGPQGLPGSPGEITFASGDARYPKRGELTVNVMDYGAVGGLGNTDDREAVMAALDVIADNGGGTLLFPAGNTFWWSQIVPLEPRHSNLKVSGYGARIGKKNVGDANYAIFSGKSMGARGYGSGVRNVVFEGITFFGDLAINRDACAFAGNHAENVTFKHCVFYGMQGQGHTVDLGGCRNINFEWCDFLGSTLGRTGNNLRAECIQMDISAAGAASAPDSAGSWSGLPTVGVTVKNCNFLPLTIGATKYPAPKPLGSHARREGAYFENVRFMYNNIVDPLFDVTSELPGDIHFTGARNVKIMYNTWTLTTPAAHIAIGFYSYDRGTLSNANNEPSETANPVVQISAQPYRDIEVSHNEFYGFSGAALDRGYVQFKNFGNNFTTVVGEHVKVSHNFYECVSTTAGMNALLVEDTKNVKLLGDTVKGRVRALQARRVNTLSVTAVDTNDTGTQSINLTDCNGFSVNGNTLVAGGSLPGILVNSGSSNGTVMGNSVGGGSSSPTQIAGSNVIATGNVVS